MGKSDAQRKRAERKRMREAGYVLRQFWVYPDDWPRVRAYLRQFKRPKVSTP